MQKKAITTEKSKVCLGITNITPDGYFLPFWDYDNKKLNSVIKDLVPLQVIFKLSDIYLFKSTNGYNALSLDKLPYNILEKIYLSSKNCCEDFIKFGLKRGFLTLRFGGDKDLIDIMKSKYSHYGKSLSHANFLTEIVGIPIATDYSFDTNTFIRLKAYRSEKNGFIEVVNFD